MMMNLFTIFDPHISMFLSFNWFSILIIFFYLPIMYWFIPSRWNMIWLNIINNINNELKIILNKKIYLINFISLFILIMLTNFLGLFSYIFTSSSHMVMTLSLSLPLWMSFMLIGWIFNMNHMFMHQVPQGTPNILMPFMVLIEFISNLIRPGTLSIRLTANMIAGHLLLTLISNNGSHLNLLSVIILIILQMTLMILEMAVSIIQAYVFTILTSLYSNEIQ